MAQLNWSMTMLGYPRHHRSGAAVVGVSHMSTHEVLRFAEEMHFYTGWLLARGSQPQLERVRCDAPVWVALAELFAERRIAKTEGVASGSLIFVAAVQAQGTPPADRDLLVWADEHDLPRVEVIDNETAYWGGLTEAQTDRLMAWFCCQRPIDVDWRSVTLDADLAGRLRGGLFEHGWTRNLGLARGGRRPGLDLWGGVHASCLLDHQHRLAPSQVHSGLRLTLNGSRWEGRELAERCILSDETGKLPVHR